MAEFTGTIEVGYYTDLWGPYLFTFPINSSATANDGLIPYGDTIQSVNVKAYLGRVNRKSTLSEETEIVDLIDSEFSPNIVSGYKVEVKLQYPGSTYKDEKATLIFEVTLASGGKKAFYFQYVRIR